MVLVDAYSKWVEIASMMSTTAETVVKRLRRVFATHGLPDVLVSDNGPQLTSAPFQTYLARHGIRHALVAPYCLVGNGLAERTVRSVKEVLTKLGPGDWHSKLATYLLAQHSTPCPTTNLNPAELLVGHRLRTYIQNTHQKSPLTPRVEPVPFRKGSRYTPAITGETQGGWLVR